MCGIHLCRCVGLICFCLAACHASIVVACVMYQFPMVCAQVTCMWWGGVEYIGILGCGASLISHRHVVYDWSRMPSLCVSLNGWSMSVCRLPGWLVRRRVVASLLYTFFGGSAIPRSSVSRVLRSSFCFCGVWACNDAVQFKVVCIAE